MLFLRHIGLMILGVFGVSHLTMWCGVVWCGVDLLFSTGLHLQSQRKSWFVFHSTLGIAQLVGGGGGGTKYLHSTQPWGGNLTYPVTCSGCHQNLREIFSSPQPSVVISHLQPCPALSSPHHLAAAALLRLAARPRLPC